MLRHDGGGHRTRLRYDRGGQRAVLRHDRGGSEPGSKTTAAGTGPGSGTTAVGSEPASGTTVVPTEPGAAGAKAGGLAAAPGTAPGAGPIGASSPAVPVPSSDPAIPLVGGRNQGRRPVPAPAAARTTAAATRLAGGTVGPVAVYVFRVKVLVFSPIAGLDVAPVLRLPILFSSAPAVADERRLEANGGCFAEQWFRHRGLPFKEGALRSVRGARRAQDARWRPWRGHSAGAARRRAPSNKPVGSCP